MWGTRVAAGLRVAQRRSAPGVRHERGGRASRRAASERAGCEARAWGQREPTEIDEVVIATPNIPVFSHLPAIEKVIIIPKFF